MTKNNMTQITQRKDDHISIALDPKAEGPNQTWLECITLVHQALPVFPYNKISISTKFLGKKISAPIIIGALTGGTEKASLINKRLAELSELEQIPMMVGSQRIAVKYPEKSDSFKIVRKNAPTAPLIANIGIAQIFSPNIESQLDNIRAMIDADALVIHLNPLQELFQDAGDIEFNNPLEKLADIQQNLSIPIIIKETGAGLSFEIIKKLTEVGIHIFDVAGVGGTNFQYIEERRTTPLEKKMEENMFLRWGIPTAASILESRSISPQNTIIASGGIRSGLDILKSIKLGADLVAIALPFLKAALKSPQEINQYFIQIVTELKQTMYLTNCKSLEFANSIPCVVFDPLKTWIQQRNLDF